MRGMTVTLDEKLGLQPARDRVVSIAGAGGKTTLMFALARSRAREGYTDAYSLSKTFRNACRCDRRSAGSRAGVFAGEACCRRQS